MSKHEPLRQNGRVRIGAFVFARSSGELFENDPEGSATPVARLAPQPARLLALLIAKNGEVLSHDEIRQELWPDVHVEFDQGLHFCIRQIRTALNDDATSAGYIETLPRRGYRLRVPVESVDQRRPSAAMRRSTWIIVAGIFVLAVVSWLAWASLTPPPQLRVAVMSFRPPADSEFPQETAQIADLLLDAMTQDDALAVIGPTSTTTYADSPTPINDVVHDYEVDYVVNGRYVETESGTLLLAEVIRASDGVHIWVQRFAPSVHRQEIVRSISRRVSELSNDIANDE